jgi:Glycosyl transferase family 2
MQMPRRPALVQTGPALVAIPARDEEAELGACLLALAEQTARIDTTVLCLNDCRDGTLGVICAHAGRLPFPLHVIEVTLPEACAFAGQARRIAMEYAADLAGRGGVLFTPDADARVGPDWVAINLAAIEAGAEAVAGRAVIETEGAKRIPAHLHAIRARVRLCRVA